MSETCKLCPAWIWAPESLDTGVCAGCRSGPPEMRLDAPRVFVPGRNPDAPPAVAGVVVTDDDGDY